MCLTFEARARSVVTREAFRTQHGRAAGRKTSRRRGGSGKITGGVVRRCRRGGGERSLGQCACSGTRSRIEQGVYLERGGEYGGGSSGGRAGGEASRSFPVT